MNVTLIPFFLAANLVVNDDVSEWKFGPEYSYNFSVTYDIKEDTSERFVTVSNSTVRCQPVQRSDNTLLCRLDDMTVSGHFTNHSSTRRRHLEKMFAIRFSEHGVAGLSIEPPFGKILANIVRKIANQLSMDVDGIRDNGAGVLRVSRHAREESTSMGTCMTEYVVRREELEANAIEKDRDFQLQVLSGIAMPGTSLSISKIRRECIDSPDFVYMKDRIFEMERFSSVVSIDDTYKTFTIINGYMKPSKASASNCTLLFQEVIELDLDDIKPADRDFSSTFHGEAIDLSINADVPDNFIS